MCFLLVLKGVPKLEVAPDEIKTFALDHHGIIAAVCKDLRIAERIDTCLGVHEKRTVSPGQAAVALILNGLGFTNRPLYLTPRFFKSKSVERLLDAPLQARDLNDYTLGHALDEYAEYGVSELFAKVAFGVALEHNLLGTVNHLDSTTLSVSGDCTQRTELDSEPKEIHLTYGHSKDSRPDLKQAVLSLVVNGPGGVPLWMEALDGNSSDKTSFQETIKKVRDFQKQVDVDRNFKWVADSALYTTERLLTSNEYLWLTRVPETIGVAREMVSRADTEITWQAAGDGYKHGGYWCFPNKPTHGRKRPGTRIWRKARPSLKKRFGIWAMRYPVARMLSEYKDQQKVARGFRFLKVPWFMVNSVFLKSPRRIEALMMVMTLCL